MTDLILETLLMISLIAVWVGLLLLSKLAWDDGLEALAIIWLVIAGPGGFAILWVIGVELYTDHPAFALDKRQWRCTASHHETTAVPITTGKTTTYMPVDEEKCDRYDRIPMS